jgi:hypothetical protein
LIDSLVTNASAIFAMRATASQNENALGQSKPVFSKHASRQVKFKWRELRFMVSQSRFS